MQSIGPPFDEVREIQHNNFSIKFDNKDNIISVEAITVRPNIIQKVEKRAILKKSYIHFIDAITAKFTTWGMYVACV